MALASIGGWKLAALRYAIRGQRGIHLDNRCFKISDEVREAIHSRKPVVALESTIYTHGFPYPDNVALASHLESTVRVHGGVPATIGVIDGIARVGMGTEELVRLAASAGKDTTLKLSRRDLGFICGMGLSGKTRSGGTTVAGTMLLAHLAGIKVFATGGLGGVHRGGESSLDISADLTELGRTPIAVVSSGCKSFLDIPRTLEYLETQGVGVATFADGRKGHTNFPAFWTRESRVSSPAVVHDEKEAAAMIYAQRSLSITSGLLFANPIPAEHSIPLKQMDGVIATAIREAEQRGATGKDNTPFILRKIKELTSGQSLPANRALIESNVIRGTRVAVELSRLEIESVTARREGKSMYGALGENTTSTSYPILHHKQQLSQNIQPVALTDQSSPFGKTEMVESHADILVAGSLAIDLSCDFTPLASPPNKAEISPQPHTSNPSIISQTIGGVGFNITTAAYLCGTSTRLCSVVGDDLSGRTALEMLCNLGLQTSAVQILGKGTGKRTAHYVAVNDAKRDLVLAMADMAILEDHPGSFANIWEPEITRAKPKWLVVDANWDAETLRKWISSGKASGAGVAFEPVSAEKSTRLFYSSTKHPLEVFPNHQIDIATPNSIELSAMHTAAHEAGMLDRQDWWQIVNSLGIHGSTRDRLVALTSPLLVDRGTPQQSIQLLPFFPCLLTKLGPQGVLLTWLLKPGDERLSSPDAARYILTRSSNGSEVGGVYMRLFPAAEVVPEEDVVSVTGVGDTFLGVMISGLKKGKTLEELVEIAQRGSVMTLKSRESVNPRLGELRKELEN
ncbi:hypothetical protein FGG08_005432 [Glutinoglossum americanum]|uniref:Carbohydrate kinase PfkB domain-containing protein n=1 Tax=Glutinoglossum americanum TaxID=1670608 RepID=A0A9P8HYG9_9PEZI|nr:hypothetical protein FGG08_005432 [Glutinoglossum americanum]